MNNWNPGMTLDQLEEHAITSAIRFYEGNLTAAAEPQGRKPEGEAVGNWVIAFPGTPLETCRRSNELEKPWLKYVDHYH